jgi:nucleoid-associated protein YgaU
MTEKGDLRSASEGPSSDPETQGERPGLTAPSPQEADAHLLESLGPFLAAGGPPPHDPPSASDTASWRYDDHGMPLTSRRRRIVRYVAPFAFLILVVALATVILESGIMKSGPTSPSASSSASGSPATTFTLYKVKKGDTLSGIAVKKHTTTTAITDLNPGLNENSLSVGQKIKIPKVTQ